MNEHRTITRPPEPSSRSSTANVLPQGASSDETRVERRRRMSDPWWQTLSILPVCMLLAGIIIFSLINFREPVQAPLLLTILLTTFFCGTFGYTAYTAARGFALTGSPGNIFFGSAMLVYSGAALMAAYGMNRPESANASITAFSISTALSGILHVVGAVSTSARFGLRRIDKNRIQRLVLAGVGSALAILAIVATSYRGLLTAFYTPWGSPTQCLRIIQGATVGLFALSTLFFIRFYLIRRAMFFYWYALALALLTVGLFGIMLGKGYTSALSWAGHVAQYLSAPYVIIAYLWVGKSARGQDIPVGRALDRFFREATANYQALVETATDAIISFDHEGRILLWNSAAERMFGFDAAEALASPLAWLIVPDDRWVNMHHNLARLLQDQRNAFIDQTLETTAHRKNGDLFPVEISASARRTPDGWIGTCIVRDVTDRKRAEDALQKSEQQLRNLIEFSTDGITMINESGAIIEWNRGMEQITGVKRREVLGRSIWEIQLATAPVEQPTGPGFLEHIQQQTLALHQTGKSSQVHSLGEHDILRSDGTSRTIQSVTFPIRSEQGWMVGGIIRDITEQRELLREVQAQRQHAEQLAQALAKERDILHTIMENTQAFLAYLDLDFHCVQTNSAFVRNSGYTQDELFEHSYFDLFPDSNMRAIFEQVRDTGQGVRFEAQPYVFANQPERGVTYWDWTLVPIRNDHNGMESLVLSLLDVTERERARAELSQHRDHLEEEVAARTAELTTMNTRLEQEIAERKRVEQALRETVARLETVNERLIALNRVGVRAQEAFVVDDLCAVVAEELDKLGLHFAILLQQEKDGFAIQHTSLADEWQAAASELFFQHPWSASLLANAPLPQESMGAYKSIYLVEPVRALAEQLGQGCSPQLRELAATAQISRMIMAPMLTQERLVGLLAIWSRELREDDIPAITAFANKIAVSIENARLFETTQKQNEQLRALSAKLADAEEIERRMISRELHDQVGQNLTALGLNLSLLSAQLPEDCRATFAPRLSDSQSLVQKTTAQVRNLMADLRPPVLDDYGLMAALRWHGERFSERTGITVTVMGEDPTPRLPDRVEIALFRIAQEALVNVAKHAQAQEVVLGLEVEDTIMRLIIADDGVGFDPTQTDEMHRRPGWGLVSMTERAEGVGGHCDIRSIPGKGTRIIVEVQR
jgi:PAS domain S-box-containing protein